MSNPFVKTALSIIAGFRETHNQPPALADVVTELAAVEPTLSPFNHKVVALQALSVEAAEQVRLAAKAVAEAEWRAAQAAATDTEHRAAEVPEEAAA